MENGKGGIILSKASYEVAAEVVQELLKARGQAISGINSIVTQNELINKYLSDEAVAAAYKVAIDAINQN